MKEKSRVLAEQLKSLCTERIFVCTAESVTAGHLQALIAAASGASLYFQGGVTAYNIEKKVRLLRVDRMHAASVNCVSAQVASEMARGACSLFGAPIGIATTGYAESSNDIPSPFAHLAIWDTRPGE
jgi:nicotinamide-nucleotide amidase